MGGPPADPLAGPHVTLALAGPARGHQHQQDRQLGGGVGQHVRRVDHDQAQPAAGLKIDVVHPHPEVAEDPRRARTIFQHGRVQRIGHRWTDGVVGPQRLGDGRRVHRLVRGVEGELVMLAQIALHILRPAAGQQHFGAGHGIGSWMRRRLCY